MKFRMVRSELKLIFGFGLLFLGWGWIVTLLMIGLIVYGNFIILQKILGKGTKIPLGKGHYFRRWVEPKDEETRKYIVKILQELCLDSVGSLLPHPVIQGEADELHNKTVLIVYNKQNEPVMFNMILRPSNPEGIEEKICHLGLVIVSTKAKGRGLQKLTILNGVLQVISLGTFPLYITDIGDSPSAARLVPTYLSNAFPNYQKPDQIPDEKQVKIFQHMLDVHKKDMGVSSKAKPNVENFVVKYSNEPLGGGAVQLAAFSRERKSRTNGVNEFFYELVKTEDYDELFLIGTLDFMCVYRILYRTFFSKSM